MPPTSSRMKKGPIPAAANFASVPAHLKDPEGHWIAWGLVTEGILYRTDKVPTPPRRARR